MMYDKQIIISTAGSRKATLWAPQEIYISELYEKFKTPVRSPETLNEYKALPKSKQDDLKDVGGFVGGALANNRRKTDNVTGRDIITLDLDNIPVGGTQDTLKRIEALGCSYAVYSTRKHEEAKPRLRVIIPTDRTITVDEYEPVARKLGQIVGIELCDPTTFEASRLMYWPSCCSDSQYVFHFGDRPFLSANGILTMYADWHDINEWPQAPGEQQKQAKLASKQGDPTEKQGIVGAFCKTYDIYQAMDTFIPDAYEPSDVPDRYTFTGGSTVGGAIIYDHGVFIYSHHATDPAGGKLCNSFDLIRLHKYADLDDEAKPDTPINKLPSYQAMCQLAVADSKVSVLLNQERYEKAVEVFGDAPNENANWISRLAVSPTSGTPLKTIANVKVMLESDPQLKDHIVKDRFANRIMGVAPLPWGAREKEKGVFQWSDEDDNGLRTYIERTLGFHSREIIDTALIDHAAAHGYDPIVTLLNSLGWDEKPRLDFLYVDYFGAEDCPYTRAVTRKAFVAAVARAMTPGCKFDTMTVVNGRQGIGKSTFFAKIGLNWFSNSVITFEGKEAAELLQGVWIVEVGELEAYSKSDIKAVRQFLSKCDDQYRAAYARKTEKHLRRCVFFGTTNDHDYLKDTKGNRRFWPVDAEHQNPKKSVFDDLTDYEVNQIWAEAFIRWQLGETLILPKELEEEAEKRRSLHMDRDPLQGQIEEFLDRSVPEDWHNWSLERRRMFWSGGNSGNLKLVPRDRICALEIWKECLGDYRAAMPRKEAYRISSILEIVPGWERANLIRFGPEYGSQRGFMRIHNMGLTLITGSNHVNVPQKFVNDVETGR